MKRICVVAAVVLGWSMVHSFPAGSEGSIDPAVLAAFGEPAALPEVFSTEVFPERDGIRPIFFEGLPYQGKPTRVFAWIGLPAGTERVPGIVLVHGGGGTAMRDWVKLWVDRGYAAIAPDLGGRVPESDATFRVKGKRHEWAGPDEKGNGFRESTGALGDQWMYHAISIVFGAERLLAGEARVDADRIGITGISWGGVITELAASLNPNFKCAAPVYGCGFLGEDSHWKDKRFPEMDPALPARWLQLWDPSHYLPRMERPILFVNGATDSYFRTGVWMKTTELPVGPVARSLRVGLTHGNPPHGDPPEVALFMDSILKGGPPLPGLSGFEMTGGEARMAYSAATPPVSADFFYTLDGGEWKSRKWQRTAAAITQDRISAPVPEQATAGFLGIETPEKARVSGPLWVR